jgi:hypothetical protein
MSEYSDDGFDLDSAMDDKPVKDNKGNSKAQTNKKPGTAPEKKVGFKLGGGIDKFDDLNKDLTTKTGASTRPQDPVKYEDLPNSLKKLHEKDELEHRKKTLTLDDIISDSKSNKHIIYKFMKKGFTALTAEELACTMVNPTFSVDFKKNTKEDWNLNY